MNLQHLCDVKWTMVKVNDFLTHLHNCRDNFCKTDTESEKNPFHNHYNHYYNKMKSRYTCTFISLTTRISYKTTTTTSEDKT